MAVQLAFRCRRIKLSYSSWRIDVAVLAVFGCSGNFLARYRQFLGTL